MAILKPDKTTTLGGVTVNEYLLTNHNSNHIDMPSVSMEGKIIGVTVHNGSMQVFMQIVLSAERVHQREVNSSVCLLTVMQEKSILFFVRAFQGLQEIPLTCWKPSDI